MQMLSLGITLHDLEAFRMLMSFNSKKQRARVKGACTVPGKCIHCQSQRAGWRGRREDPHPSSISPRNLGRKRSNPATLAASQRSKGLLSLSSNSCFPLSRTPSSVLDEDKVWCSANVYYSHLWLQTLHDKSLWSWFSHGRWDPGVWSAPSPAGRQVTLSHYTTQKRHWVREGCDLTGCGPITRQRSGGKQPHRVHMVDLWIETGRRQKNPDKTPWFHD